jgi:RNA recognition motif-containing protein
MKLYVGNLSYDTSEDELRQAFSAFGEVTSVSIPSDRVSGRSKGFAFVELATKAAGEAAIAGLNGKSLKERTITVAEARPRTDSRPGGGYGGSRGGGRDYGGGGYGGGRGGRSGGGRSSGGGRGGRY